MSAQAATAQAQSAGSLIPEGMSFESWLNTRIARFKTRTYDWDVLKVQADSAP